jgi:hypothetical protein
MSTVRPFGTNTLSTFLYEPFSFTISPLPPGTSTVTTSNTPGIPPGYLVSNVFATASNGMNTGSELFTITARDSGGTVLGVSSNTVSISSGRFVDASGNGYTGSNYVFFKSEPITPIRLVAPFDISVPTSVPTLPPGLTYSNVSPTTFDIVGTPLVTVPQSNYLVIGKATGSNLGKIVTSQFGISISNERVLLDLSGTPIVSPMVVGTAITPRVLTALFPPYPSGGTLRYSWPGLPDGIVVTDASGNVQGSTFFTPTDASSTLILAGTPSITAANAFRDANISNVTVPFTATRTSPLPQISNVSNITFGFGETVLFDTVNVPTLYSGVALDPSATFFRAQTYFGSSSPISNIFSPDLRADLSINFVSAQGRGYLFSPTTPGAPIGTNSFTIRAINSNLISRDLSIPITVAEDVVTFSLPPPIPVDVCYNFVLSRPASLALDGYYPSNIQFQASAASGNAVVFTSTGLTGTGLVLSNISSNTVQIAGIPDTVTPLSTVTITASAVGTPATASRTIQLAVLNDTITLFDVSSLSFFQNRTITPIQFSASTLSSRPVTSFTSANLPNGLSLSVTGLLTGAPLDSTASPQTFTVNASTGFTSQNRAYTYSAVADNILVVLPGTTATLPITFSNLPFDVLSYSGASGNIEPIVGQVDIVPYQTPSPTITVTQPNFLSGDFSGLPVLAQQYRFRLTGQAGLATEEKQIDINVSNTSFRHINIASRFTVFPDPSADEPPFPTASVSIAVSFDEPVTFTSATGYTPVATGPGNGFIQTYGNQIDGNAYDMARSSNVVVAVLGSNIIRSDDYGMTWTRPDSPQTPRFVYGPQWSGLPGATPRPTPRIRFENPLYGSIATDGQSNWWAVGAASIGDEGSFWDLASVVIHSSDNGLTWSSVQTNTPISSIDSFYDKLTYNEGRLFATRRDSVLDGTYDLSGIFYADVSNVSSWTIPSTPIVAVAGLAASNSTLFAISASDTLSPIGGTAISTDNGTTWAVGTNITTDASNNTQYFDIAYSRGKWGAVGMSSGFNLFRWSSNLTDWTNLLGIAPPVGSLTSVADNGLSWVATGAVEGTGGWYASLYDSNGGLVQATELFISSNAFGHTKRLFAPFITTGDPTLTFSISYQPLGISFTSPTQTRYTSYQYVPIPTIPVQASIPNPNDFIYYYASGLPRGLALTLDASGITASIGGISSQFSDAFQDFILYAAVNPNAGGGVAALSLSMRTILPTVEKQQTSAGAFTSLVRQYTIVNAAQNSVNGRALPATEPPLGEFTRPHPPDSVSAPGDPNCAKKC